MSLLSLSIWLVVYLLYNLAMATEIIERGPVAIVQALFETSEMPAMSRQSLPQR